MNTSIKLELSKSLDTVFILEKPNVTQVDVIISNEQINSLDQTMGIDAIEVTHKALIDETEINAFIKPLLNEAVDLTSILGHKKVSFKQLLEICETLECKNIALATPMFVELRSIVQNSQDYEVFEKPTITEHVGKITLLQHIATILNTKTSKTLNILINELDTFDSTTAHLIPCIKMPTEPTVDIFAEKTESGVRIEAVAKEIPNIRTYKLTNIDL